MAANKKYFIVSDTHSFYDELQQALTKKGFDFNNPSHYLVVAGDLFDRGPGSKPLWEFVQSLGDRFLYVRGNHEDLIESCLMEVVSGNSLGRHHLTNGTVRTIADICGVDYWDVAMERRSEEVMNTVWIRSRPLVDFIRSRSVNHLELGDFIVVHGWIPCHTNLKMSAFREAPTSAMSRDQWDEDSYEMKSAWEASRWINGMDAWDRGCTIPGKTVICGHWHTSWGWSNLKHEVKEWPLKKGRWWQNAFKPFAEEGILAIDGCIAYSGRVNCIVLEENSRGKVRLISK